MKRSFLIAGVIALAVGAWVLSGQFGETANEPEVQKPPAELEAAVETPRVRVRVQSAESYQPELVLNGRTQALHEVEIKTETEGRVTELHFERGDFVTPGQELVKLAPDDRPEALAEARSLLEQRRLEYDVASKLKDKGFRPETELASSRAQLQAAQAAVRRAEVALARTTIEAPFEGRIEERMVEIGDYLEIGHGVARLVDLDPMLIVAEANERHVEDIEVGGVGQATLASGQVVAGRVRYVASSAEPATRTFRVELEISNPDGAIPDGISAVLSLPLEERQAHLVSPAILTLDDEGRVGVMLLDAENRAHFTPVEIVDDTPQGVWLAGLPESATFITVGQEFVVDGQTVEAVDEGSLEPLAAGEGAGTGGGALDNTLGEIAEEDDSTS